LAGVSVSWYTRLERGDAVGASDAMLNAVARTLQLNELECRPLFHLARGSQGSATRTPTRRPAMRPVSGTMQLVLDQMTDLPAVVENDRSDVVAMNALARALYSGMLSGPASPWNHARYIHLDAGARSFYRDWDEIASSSAAMLHVAAAKDPFDSDLFQLIGELATHSEDLRVRWATRDVHEHRVGVKRLHHELVGDIDLVHETLALSGDPGLTLFRRRGRGG
jgi:hypothetical protein